MDAARDNRRLRHGGGVLMEIYPEIPCTHCGEMFPPSRAQYRDRHSRKVTCQYCLATKINQPKPKLTCACCGKMFRPAWTTRRRHEHGHAVYCSRPCAAKMQRRKSGPNRNKKIDERVSVAVDFKKPITPWVPYSGVGSPDFPALLNPF